MSRGARTAGLLLVGYTLFLAVAVLSPSSHEQSSAVTWLVVRLQHLGLPSVTYQGLEIVMNGVIVAPVTLLASFFRQRYSWRDWTAFGFVAAVAVESIQGLFLPHRHASFSDVVANTTGALVGALLARVVRGRRRVSSPS